MAIEKIEIDRQKKAANDPEHFSKQNRKFQKQKETPDRDKP